MYQIYFYRDKNGREPVKEYIAVLAGKKDKDSRIKLNKIMDYIKALSEYGTRAGEPYIKHLNGDIWELRPLRDRILFAAWNGKGFVLLHVFLSRRKKPRREKLKGQNRILLIIRRGGAIMKTNKEYSQAVAQAQENLTDINERGSDAIGGNVLEFMESILTPEEIVESNLRVSIIGELIKARQEKGISQKKLEELSGVKQPIIARMEKGSTSPQLSTILKVLAPLGKTLAVVPLETVSK